MEHDKRRGISLMKQHKRMLAAILCILFLTCASCRAQNTVVRADKKLSEISYEGFSLEKSNAIAGEIREILTKPHIKSRAAQLCKRFDSLLEEYDKCTTQFVLITAQYNADPHRTQAETSYNETNDSATALDDLIKTLIGEIYSAGYGEVLEEYTGSEKIAAFDGHTALTDEMNECSDLDDELCTEYMRVSTSDEYSGRARYKRMGELIVDMVNVRNEYALLKGYSNYIDYAFENIYMRDYTMQQFSQAAEYIRTHLSEAYFKYDNITKYSDTDGFDSSRMEEGMRAIADNENLPETVREASSYMLEYELIYKPDPQKSIPSTWCGKLYTQNEPVMYISNLNNITDTIQILHESGHYLNFYILQQPAFYDNLLISLEIAETQSQGYMLMYWDEYAQAFPEYRDAIENETLYELIRYIYDVSMRAEFEYRLYTEPNLTYERACEIYAELCSLYGFSTPEYGWSGAVHYAERPAYLVSYPVSALAAAAIWDISLSDDAQANEIYANIASYGSNMTFMKMCEQCGLGDVFGEDFIIKLKTDFETRK